MKTINLTLFSFDELSENVQKKIIERERWNVMERRVDCCASEYKASLKSFEKLTDTEACDWNVGYSGYSFDFMFDDLLYYEDPYDCGQDICLSDLRGKLLFRYINNNIMPYITKGRYYSKGKYVDGKYQYKDRHSKILLENNNCPLTGVCYDQDILDPIIRYYKTWNSYPEDFSWPDLMRQCYDNFFKSWHEEYEYWADDESALREELHNNQYEDRLYYKNGDVYVGQLNEIA